MVTTDAKSFERFLSIARETADEAIGVHRSSLAFLEEVDRLFIDHHEKLGSVKPGTAGLLLLNAHACLRAAFGLALSGQLLPMYMTLRGALESALYANAMAVDKKLESIWLERESSENAKRLCRKKFSADAVLELLGKAQDKSFADRVRDAYDSTIDFGAHPNSRVILKSTRITQLVSGARQLDFAYIHGPRSFEVKQSLIACLEVGFDVFFVSLISCPDHEHLQALNERALELQGRIPSLVTQLGLRQ